MNTDKIKIYKKIEVKYILTESEPPQTIDSMTDWLKKMEDKGASWLEWETNADDEVIKCTAYSSELESDEQYELRVKEEWGTTLVLEEKDRQEYERLKAKFDDK